MVPPDPIPNSEVKRVSGDGSVGFPHVRVAHRQAPNSKEARSFERAFLINIGTATAGDEWKILKDDEQPL